jgi:hypothetical protein
LPSPRFTRSRLLALFTLVPQFPNLGCDCTRSIAEFYTSSGAEASC